jgi:hypothetical protein
MISGLCTLGCGPDRAECTGSHADFSVTLKLRDGPLPPDTVVHVTYGGSGMEDYSPQEQGATHEVVFCRPRTLDGGVEPDAAESGAAGTSGAEENGVDELKCDLWTGGFATLQVRTTGLTTMIYKLTPREHVCTVTQTIVLDSPDAG